jgi:hypothetical protein
VPLVTVIHDAFPFVVQLHPACVVTAAVKGPPVPGTFCVVGDRL